MPAEPAPSVRRCAALAALLALAVAAAACNVNEYCVDCDPVDAPVPDAGPDGGDAGDGAADATPDACVPMGAEACNGLDDDCDGVIDEDVLEVGTSCGTDVGACSKGSWECTDGQLACTGGVQPEPEACNGIDDDCDGNIDDGDPGGGVVCGSDIGECVRGVTACADGEVICDGEVGPSPELCNAADDDCDGMIDEGDPEGGAACGDSMGACMPGAETCLGGEIVCVGGDGPSYEQCDGIDNDCDGEVDEDYDFDGDPKHCGGCNTSCSVNNGQAGCAGGDCQIAYCFTGWWDLDGQYANGCEYACELSGAEVCNGLDDDCDGQVDEGLSPPDICSSIGECAGTTASCAGTDGWTCDYGPTVSTDANGDVVPESTCDGLDNDCDGLADDPFTQLGDTCTKGTGACETSGAWICNQDQDGVECSAAEPGSGNPETCNGLDDDCDGQVDEGAPDHWVQVSGSLWIYQYEASRPDADGASKGNMGHRPCSAPGRLPWTNVTQPAAEALCQDIGARLCTESEWAQACRSTSNTCTWSFADQCTSYAGNESTCNGNDYDYDPNTPADDDGLLPTGALNQCYAAWAGGGVFDMSGNVKEWTVERSPGVNPLRGGSYNNTASGIACDFDFTVADDTFQFDNVGFRCCRDTAP